MSPVDILGKSSVQREQGTKGLEDKCVWLWLRKKKASQAGVA